MNKMYIGVSDIPGSQRTHYAILVNDTVYEINGNTPNFVVSTPSSASEFIAKHRLLYTSKISSTTIDKTTLITYMNDWCRKHSIYNVYADNCQTFAKDILRDLFNVIIITQTDTVKKYALIAFLCSVLVMTVSMLVFFYPSLVFWCFHLDYD